HLKYSDYRADGIGWFFFFLITLNLQLMRMGILQKVMTFREIKFKRIDIQIVVYTWNLVISDTREFL
ncbi:MAG: hypothetical protein ACLT4A_16585, partial [Anaerobutyricum soehngenii]